MRRDRINSIVGWNSLSIAGKLSSEGDFFQNLKNPPVVGSPHRGREMLSDSQSTKSTLVKRLDHRASRPVGPAGRNCSPYSCSADRSRLHTQSSGKCTKCLICEFGCARMGAVEFAGSCSQLPFFYCRHFILLTDL
jgi:hypothetical protein